MISVPHRPATGPAKTIPSASGLIAKFVKMGGNSKRFDAIQKYSKKNQIYVCFDPPFYKTSNIVADKVWEISQ